MSDRAVPTLNIPSKNLEDNFKLKDFQNDFSGILALALSTTAKPKRIEFTNMNEMDVTYDDGRFVQYRFERNGKQITKIINLTDNKETVVSW